MLAFVVAIASFFNLHPAVKIAIVALVASPVPPLLPARDLIIGPVIRCYETTPGRK
jgi:hypothetical protein